jgi:hypothetical protein
MTSYAKPTDAQREAHSASFKRRYDQKAQIAAKRQWVLDGELTAEQLLARSRQLRAESRIARAQLGERVA